MIQQSARHRHDRPHRLRLEEQQQHQQATMRPQSPEGDEYDLLDADADGRRVRCGEGERQGQRNPRLGKRLRGAGGCLFQAYSHVEPDLEI